MGAGGGISERNAVTTALAEWGRGDTGGLSVEEAAAALGISTATAALPRPCRRVAIAPARFR